ncbi:exo-rhamnogalacturonan lyase family protein [Desulfoluna spongiiphila]|uniref:exo-rhamnogalacturonan lyase family protein n=1 Tax=Desulfoluna spongiiphila TaxID=419481 RepID=UPI001254DCCA|nr:hypothetical protein [Desulfoluna spongiiphila]VVS94008.1 hypothetical protein DBB_35800 [Desulfoluna spongiiphila]
MMKESLQGGLKRRVWCAVAVMFCVGGVMSTHGECAVDPAVRIEIRELLPDAVTGLDRTHEAATFGVPLRDCDGVQSINELGLSGLWDYQFRVLHRYPNGNIHWVLIDTLASVPAGEGTVIWLTNGSGNSSGNSLPIDLAEDNGNTITVDTGAARFVIRKAHYNVFDSVVAGSTAFLSNTGGITAVSGTTQYSSANDELSTAVIEENGPIKAVIRCEGHLKPASGPWLLGYTMRMYFYKGSGRTRLDLILKNAEISSYSVKIFESVRIELPTTMVAPSYLFSTGPGVQSGGVIDGTAHLYQGYSSHKYVQYLGGADLLKERLVPDVGLEVANGTTVIHALGDEEDYTEGYAAMYSEGMHINCGIRNLYGMWPTGFTMAEDGHLYIDVFSPRNTKDDIRFAFFAHDKRQVVLEFTPEAKDPKQTFYTLQYPLSGRADFEHYAGAQAVYGEDRLATHAETRDFLAEIGLGSYEISNEDTLRRYYVWGQGGGPNQYDLQLCKYLHYLQTGNGGAFLAAQNDDHHKMFGSVKHSDDFDVYVQGPTLFRNVNTTSPPDQNLTYNSKFFDREHSHDVSVPVGYFLTGDESLMDAWRDYGEYTLYDQGSGKGSINSYYDGTTYVGYPRIFSRALRRAGAYGQYASTSVWREKIGRMVGNFMGMRATPADDDQDGWDLDRGFFYMSRDGSRPDGVRSNKVFMAYDIFPNSFWYYVPGNFDDPLMYEDYQDYILGLAYHSLREIIPLEHQPYGFKLDEANAADPIGEYPFSFLMAKGYELTGNDSFLDEYIPHYRLMLITQSEERVYSPYSSKFIHNYENRDILTGYVAAEGAGRVDLGNSGAPGVSRSGSVYTLTWQAPMDEIIRYQIKFSAAPMVENLNFDQVTRAYEYAPSAYDNFWAALNIANEPTPKQSEGDVETVSIDVAQAINAYNTRYGLTAGQPAYQVYDDQTDYFFSVKFFADAPIVNGIDTPLLPCPP